MIRQRENSVMWQAGVLSLLVHGLFFVVLVMTFSLKSIQPMQVAEVELWDSVPAPRALPPPEPPRPEPKIERVPEPEPPPPEPKAEIQVKPKPPAKPKLEPKPEPKPKEEKPKPDPKAQARKEEEQRRLEEKRKIEEIKRAVLQDADPSQDLDREAKQVSSAAKNAQASALAASGALDGDIAKLAAKIHRFMNSQVCGSGKPMIEVGIALMPTGEVIGDPRLKKSSGIPACDDAVVRAILQAQPLPVPREPERFAPFRDLSLKFWPNDH